MSSAFQLAFTMMTQAGIDPGTAADTLSAVALEGAAALAKPSAGALRVRRFRERKKEQALLVTHVTPKIENMNKNNEINRYTVTPPPQPPYKKESKKESKIQEVLVIAAQGGKKEDFGYTSFDGSIIFTAAEITALSLKYHSLPKIYSQICELAETPWIASTHPLRRKKNIMGRLRNLHDAKMAKISKAPQKSSEEIQTEADERDRSVRKALEVRRRHGIGHG